MSESSREITQMLRDWSGGRREALDELMPLVHAELRRQASRYLRGERPGHTLQTTALINEAYLKLVDQREVDWQNRAHFYAIAAQAMKRILVDHARERNRQKRGGPAEDLPLDEARYAISGQDVDLVEVDEALSRLAVFDPQQASIVELKFFGGFSIDEIGDALQISAATVKREWTSAKTWLKLEMTKA